MHVSPLDEPAPPLPTNWRRPLAVAAGLVGMTFGVCGAWAAMARLDGAAIATGVVASQSNRKTVQHYEGGIIGELLVRDGDRVRADDVLVRLDPTRVEASAVLYRQQLAAALATDARLVAERDGRDTVDFPTEVTTMAKSAVVVERALADQQRQFSSRRETLVRQIEVMQAQTGQIQKEIQGIHSERETSEKQLVWIRRELDGLRTLIQKNLVDISRYSTMEREFLRYQGLIARAAIDVARAEQRIAETEIKIEQLREEYRAEASKQLPETRKLISDLRQQITISEDALRRIEVRAPIDGTVQQLRIFTRGGVIRPGDPILDIVPATDELVVQAKVSPIDIDAVRPGLTAEVRFAAFQRNNAPFATGRLRTVSRDRLVDEASKEPYFAAEVTVNSDSLPEDLRGKLTAGMSADVVIPLGERTVLQYLVSPLTDRMHQALRER